VSGRSGDDRSDEAAGNGGENVIAIHLAPLIATGRGVQVIVTIVNALATAPVIVTHMLALSPIVVANVVMVAVVIVVVVIL